MARAPRRQERARGREIDLTRSRCVPGQGAGLHPMLQCYVLSIGFKQYGHPKLRRSATDAEHPFWTPPVPHKGVPHATGPTQNWTRRPRRTTRSTTAAAVWPSPDTGPVGQTPSWRRQPRTASHRRPRRPGRAASRRPGPAAGGRPADDRRPRPADLAGLPVRTPPSEAHRGRGAAGKHAPRRLPCASAQGADAMRILRAPASPMSTRPSRAARSAPPGTRPGDGGRQVAAQAADGALHGPLPIARVGDCDASTRANSVPRTAGTGRTPPPRRTPSRRLRPCRPAPPSPKGAPAVRIPRREPRPRSGRRGPHD